MATQDLRPARIAIMNHDDRLAAAVLVDMSYQKRIEDLKRAHLDQMSKLNRDRDRDCAIHAERRIQNIALAQQELQALTQIDGEHSERELVSISERQAKREAAAQQLRFEIHYAFELYHLIANDKDTKYRELKAQALELYEDEVRNLADQRTRTFASLGIPEDPEQRITRSHPDTELYTDGELEMTDQSSSLYHVDDDQDDLSSVIGSQSDTQSTNDSSYATDTEVESDD